MQKMPALKQWKNGDISFHIFLDKLKSLNIYDDLNQTMSCNLQENYAILSEIFRNVKNKYLLKKNHSG